MIINVVGGVAVYLWDPCLVVEDVCKWMCMWETWCMTGGGRHVSVGDGEEKKMVGLNLRV